MLQLQFVPLRIARRIRPNRPPALHLIDRLWCDRFEPPVGQPICARVNLTRVLARDHKMLFMECLWPLTFEEDKDIFMIDTEPLRPPCAGVAVSLVNDALE